MTAFGFTAYSVDTEEIYDTFDEFTLSDLGLNPGNFENSISAGGYSYTGNSSSHSVVVKFQWEPHLDETDDKGWLIVLDFDYNYRAGVWFRGRDIRFCYNSEKTDPYQKLSSFTSGRHSVEFGRKFVVSGPNNNKYYVYLKVDDEILADGYTDEYSAAGYNSGNGMQNRIYFNGNLLGNQRFADTLLPGNEESYDPYDEINYTDLMDSNGQPLKENTNYTGATILTYNRTSPSGSAILKYRWTVGSVPKFQLSFDHAYESNGTTKSMDYMFGVQVSIPSNDYPDGELYLRPGYGNRSNLNDPFEVENIYDIEFARLKVATGPNKGKYYVYIKVDGLLISKSYTDANIVDDNNRYNTRPGVNGNTEVTISNKIYLAFWGSTNNKLSKTWDTGKGHYVNYYANGNLVEKVPFTLDDPTVEGREPAVPTIPQATGVWENHPTIGLTKECNVNAVYTVTPPTAAGAAITLNRFDGATVDLTTDIIHDYLALTPGQQSDFVRNYSASFSGYQDHQNLSFRWSASGSESSYTAYFADNPDFDDPFIISTSHTALINEIGIFVSDKTYYWFVAGNDSGKCSAVDTFTVSEGTVRYITAGTVINMRDEGGYMTDSGHKIKYGLVYRGASLDEETSFLDNTAYHVFRYLGMKSEIELRGGYAHTKTGWDNTNANVYHINGVYYSEILSMDDQVKAQYKATFEAMADRSNYPFYFHCSAGADRTGTFAYLLNGLLGVSFEELREDYELTSFSKMGRRTADSWSDNLSFDKMHSDLMLQYGDGSGNVSAAIENFLTQYIGIDQSTLDSIKEIMLETDPFDLNRDTMIDAHDITILMKALLFGSTDVKYDVNTDGKIDILDLVKMKKYLAGLVSNA